MAYTKIDDPSVYFQSVQWTGDNADTRNITNDGNSDLQPDWLWIKAVSAAGNGYNHNTHDSQRGVDSNINKTLVTDDNDREGLGNNVTTSAQMGGVSAFLSDGFTVKEGNTDDARMVNKNTVDYIGWSWKANGGTSTGKGSESGNNPAYNHQANTTSGFSIVTYTGTGAAGTVTHGLSVAPRWVLNKGRDDNHAWITGHVSDTADFSEVGILNNADAFADDDNSYNDTAPTSSVFTVNDAGGVNNDGQGYVAYCFHDVKGFSKFNKYVGNGNANGPFVHTGFKPQMIIIKDSDNSRNWAMADIDLVTAGNGGVTNALFPNITDAKDANVRIDFLCNGFKIRTTSTTWNNNNSNYIYMAWAKSPFVSSEGTPTTAF